jgi:DNA recombination protein RmuC
VNTALIALATAALASAAVWLLLRQQAAVLAERLRARDTDNARLAAELAAAQQSAAQFTTLHAQLSSDLAATKADAAARLATLAEARDRLAADFKTLAADALSRNSDEFLKRADTALMKPVNESLKDVREKISEIEKARATAYGSLSEQLKTLASAQSALQTEATKLSRSLRSTSTAGRWGELQLQRVVELSGMVEHVDFVQQQASGDIRPDMVIRLPGGKQIAVDAKAPMQAYLEAVEAGDETVRKSKFLEHARAVRLHIDALGAKSYWKSLTPSPEFVVLFVPGEAFYAAALRYEPDLFERGTGVGVILASPATLIALLKAAAYGWKQEALSKNADEIRKLGLELHERVSTVAENLDVLGQRLSQAIGAYNSTVSQIEGRVLVTGRKLEKLGSGSEKKITEPRLVDDVPKTLTAPELKR